MTTSSTTGELQIEDSLADVVDDYVLSLHAAGKSKATRILYRLAVEYLDGYLADQGMPRTLRGIRREHIESWFVSLREAGRTPATVSAYYRSLQPFWKWAIEEGLLDESPMRNMKRPKVPEQKPPVLTREQVERLMKVCQPHSRADFEGYRDAAIVALLATTGIRRGELAGLTVNDVELNTREGVGVLRVLGKGGRKRDVPFGILATQALNRYKNQRKYHAKATATDRFWLGYRGPLTADGVRQVLERRGQAAGIPGMHAHLLRHYFNDQWSRAGGSESGVMQIAGWTTSSMPRRYAASTANQRAHDEYHRLGIGDRL